MGGGVGAMASNVIGGIAIEIVDDSARFTQSMERNAALVENQSQRMTRALGGTAKSVDDLDRKASSFHPDPFRGMAASALRAQNNVERLQRTLLALTAAAGGGFAGAIALKALTETADRYTNIQNRIAAIVQTGNQRVEVEGALLRIAQETRSSYESTAQLFQRISMGANMLGASQKQVLEVVETVQKALQAGGASTMEAASAAVQFSQALGSGRLAGDELRSILENSQVLASAIAKEFGVSVAALHDMGAAGELTSDRVFKAILTAGVDIDKQFKALRPTIAQSMQVLDNAFTSYIGHVDKSLGVSNAMAQGIISLANNLQSLGNVAMVVAPLLGAVFANRVVGRVGRGIGAPFAAAQEAADQRVKTAKAAADEAKRIREEAEINRKNADFSAREFAKQPTFHQAAPEAQREFSRATASLDKAQAQAEAATTRHVALLEQRVELEGRAAEASKAASTSVDRARSVVEAREKRLNDLLAQRPALEKAAAEAGGTVSRPQQTAFYQAIANEVDARDRVATARRQRIDVRDALRAEREFGSAAEGSALVSSLQRQAELEQHLTAIESNRVKGLQDLNKAVQAQDQLNAQLNAKQSSDRERAAAKLNEADARIARGAQQLAQAREDEARRVVTALNSVQAAAQKNAAELQRLDSKTISARQERDRALTGVAQAQRGVTEAAGPITASAAERRGAAAADVLRATVDAGRAQAQLAAAEQTAARAISGTSFAAVAGAASLDGLKRASVGLVDFLGGPFGVIFTAVVAGLGLYALGQAKGAEAAERHKAALDGLADRLKAVREEAAKGAVRSLTDVSGDRTAVRESAKSVRDIREKVRQEVAGLQYGSDSQRTQDQAQQLGINTGQLLATLRVGGPLSQETVGALADVTRLAEFLEREGTPAAQKHAAAILKLAEEYAGARAKVMEFEAAARAAATRAVQAGGRQSVYDTDFKPDVVGLRIGREMEAQRQLNAEDPALRIPTGIELTDQITKEIEDAKNRIRSEWGEGVEDPALRLPTGIEITGGIEQEIKRAQETLSKALSNIGQSEFDDAAKMIGTSSSEIIRVLGDTKAPADQTAKAIDDLAKVLTNLSGTRLDLSGPIDEALRAAQAFLTASGMAARFQNAMAQAAQAREATLGAKRIDEMVGTVAPAAVPDIVKSQVEQNLLRRANKKDTGLEDQDRAVEIQDKNRGMFTRDEALSLARRERSLQEAKAPKKGAKPKETPGERLSERIKRIREESESAFLPEMDKEVIAEITKTKGTADIAGDVRKKLQAGTPLTGEFADLKSAITAREAAKEYKNIVEQYGNMAQVTPFVRTEQEKLNFLLSSGKIDAMQAGSALADYMAKFKEFQWIDKLTDSLKGFGDTLADTLYDGKLNADTFAEAVNNLGKALFKLTLDEVALRPLREMLRGGLATAFAPGGGGLAGLFGGGGGGIPTMAQGGYGPDIPVGVGHLGGFAGALPQMRMVPSGLFWDAPHYRGGLRPGEFAAVLHQGEAVLTQRQQASMAALASGVSGMRGGINVVVNEAPGTRAEVSQGDNGGLQVDIFSAAEAGFADRLARGKGPLAKASRAGGRANLRG